MAAVVDRARSDAELHAPAALRVASCGDAARGAQTLLARLQATGLRSARSAGAPRPGPRPAPQPADDPAATAVRAACGAAPALRAVLGLGAAAGAHDGSALKLTRLSGGLSNSVFLVEGPSGGKVVVKHGLDHHMLVPELEFDLVGSGV
jgi:hypothetical protein